ncbi:hypothetical protein [Streptomyces sporangiiformans]|uniref:hypothetical protein n=1 Tax=Streptomyces sporangiiformans TaxID=2315329 RepID=UPI001F09A9BF|nr:hypothetical protein [Streptomyces sporangiiformans]
MKDRKAALRFGSRSAVHLADPALLVRAPAALSVPGDVIAGAAAAERPLGVRTLGVTGSSACLFAGHGRSDRLELDPALDEVKPDETSTFQGNSARRGGA